MDSKLDINLVQGGIVFLLNIPLWTIILYMIKRMVDKRDKTEDKIFKKLEIMSDNINDIRVKIAQWESDAKYTQLMVKSIGQVTERVQKAESDINLAYERIRQIDKRSD
jgi:hypothetical protein